MHAIAKPLRTRPLLVTVAASTLLCTVLRTLALTLCFDSDIGYFNPGVLPVLTYVLEGLILALCIAVPFLIKYGVLPSILYIKDSEPRTVTLVGNAVTALLCLLISACLFFNGSPKSTPPALVIIAFACSFPAAFYFILPFFKHKPQTAALLCYMAILSVILLLAITYFDRYTPMNSPHKLSLHMAFLAICLALVAEARCVLDLPRSALYAAAMLLAASLCAVFGISNTIAFLAGSYESLFYLSLDLFCVGLAVFFGTRAFALSRMTEPLVEEVTE